MRDHIWVFVIATFAVGPGALARGTPAPQVAAVVPHTRLPVDAAHRHVTLTALPMKGGKIDMARLLIDSSGIGERALLNLTPAQKQDVQAQINLMRSGKLAESVAPWRKLVGSLRGGSRAVSLDAVLRYVLRQGVLAKHPQIAAAAATAAQGAARVAALQARVGKLRAAQARCKSRAGACTPAQQQSGQQELLDATKQMQEMQTSFNLQYLQLQNKISHENRQFTMVSNIMKTKHDTAKSSINNIR